MCYRERDHNLCCVTFIEANVFCADFVLTTQQLETLTRNSFSEKTKVMRKVTTDFWRAEESGGHVSFKVLEAEDFCAEFVLTKRHFQSLEEKFI